MQNDIPSNREFVRSPGDNASPNQPTNLDFNAVKNSYQYKRSMRDLIGMHVHSESLTKGLSVSQWSYHSISKAVSEEYMERYRNNDRNLR